MQKEKVKRTKTEIHLRQNKDYKKSTIFRTFRYFRERNEICEKQQKKVAWRCSVKRFLKISQKFTGKDLCQSLFFKTLAKVFSCKFCEIFKNTIFYRTPPVVASELLSFLFILFFGMAWLQKERETKKNMAWRN